VVFLLGLAIIAAGFPLINSILYLFGATEDLLSYAREYLEIVIFGVPFIVCTMAGNNIARAEGRAKIAMVSMFLGAGLNILLDPLFIFGFHMGIRGAATATIISQFFSFLFLTMFFAAGKTSLSLRFRHLLPKLKILREITVLGIPAFIRQGGMSILFIVINNTLGFYGGDIYISAYGVISRLLMFLVLPLLGMVQGFQPIAGYNYGAKNTGRLSEVLRLALTVTTVYATGIFLLMQGIPGFFVGIFTSDTRLIETATPFLRIVMMFIPLIGFQIIGASFFQAIGKAFPAFFLGLSRQILFLIPLAFFLPLLFGIRGVMMAFPAADILSTLLTTVMLIPTLRRLNIHPVKDWFR
jgi:putative MATE family efflux protein